MALTDHTRRTAAPDLRRTTALVVGDVVAFNLVTALGLYRHGELTDLGALGQVVQVAAPFLASWLLVAPFLGAFRRDVVDRPPQLLARSALAWLVALPIGLMLWSLMRQRQVQPTFAAVTFITNLVVLLGWRGVFAVLAPRGRRR